MADDEQFSLCWNNFNTNLSAGFHESLCRGDLVDVTLAAEGQFVKAHRLVLSVCSPLFREMFTQMPPNQHAFIFLKDVSHSALKDLIQFMYCGEVNVKQEALPAFISTAESLQIKGLTDTDPPPAQTPPEPATPTPQIPQLSSPRVRQQRTSIPRSYKIETIDNSGDEKSTTQIVIQTAGPQTTIPQQTTTQHYASQPQHSQLPTQQISVNTGTTTTTVAQKRPAQRILSSSHVKRTKSTIDPLETSTSTAEHSTAQATQQITVQTAVVSEPKSSHQNTEAEYIDLQMEIPTKSEPDYTEEEVGDVDHEGTTYVEDDSYGELRYDESYFTENEDAGAPAANTATSISQSSAVSVGSTSATSSKAIVKQQIASFSDSSYVDSAEQNTTDAQEKTSTENAERNICAAPAKKGRPRKVQLAPNPARVLDKIIQSLEENVGVPLIYASTTKGSMKIIYSGHHFRYSFRTGKYSIFQCCYNENKQGCKVRVFSDQKRVFPLDGEHVHFMQATDKSVTSIAFEPAESKVIFQKSIKNEVEVEKEIQGLFQVLAPVQTGIASDESVIDMDSQNDTAIDKPITAATSDVAVDPNDFREKIKKRLQKALLGKKK